MLDPEDVGDIALWKRRLTFNGLHDIYPKGPENNYIQFTVNDSVMPCSEVPSLHPPRSSDENHKLLDRRADLFSRCEASTSLTRGPR
jgi:hypothetical protein